MPLAEFAKALAGAAAADQLAPQVPWLQGRPVKVADGSALKLPDTPKNRKAYGPIQTPEPNFPQAAPRGLFTKRLAPGRCTAGFDSLYLFIIRSP